MLRINFLEVDVSLSTRQWCCSSIFPGPSGL
ncbi:MAG: hypothetical protein ACI974_001508, partial [Paraglaciecola sp.]